MNLIQQIEAEEIAKAGKTIPEFRPGDTVRVGNDRTGGHYQWQCFDVAKLRAIMDSRGSQCGPQVHGGRFEGGARLAHFGHLR